MKEYIKPMMDMELFAANEYFSACGDSGTTYLFQCNAGIPKEYHTVYVESNGVDGLQTRSSGSWSLGNYVPADTRRTDYYHPCGAEHKASSEDEFLNGYIMVNGEAQEVIILTNHGTNTHCTTILNKDDWETAKS